METQTVKRKNTDQILLEAVREHPGLSQYELSKHLEWSPGKVDGAVRRLLNSDDIFLRVIERNGRKVNLVYPKDAKPLDIIEIPKKLLDKDKPTWKKTAFIYALDNVTIGITGQEEGKWEEIAGFHDQVPLRHTGHKAFVKIPERFVSFYNLKEKYRTIFLEENKLLVTVSGDIIEEKDYPS